MTNVLAIDQGTSGTKAVVVDGLGRVHALCEIPLFPAYGDDGRVEQDPEALWGSVVEAGRQAMRAATVRVDAVALANQGESVLAWDPRTGAPLTPILVWQDRRAAGICAELSAHAAEIARRTGLRLDPYFSAPKQAWIRRHLTGEGVVTTSDVWLLHRLTGAFATDPSTASRSLVYDPVDGEWSQHLLELFGLGSERLPDVRDNDAVIGTTTVFGAELPVAGAVVDQQAALVAQTRLEPGVAKCTFGTGAFLGVGVGSRPVLSTAGLTTSVAARIAGVDSFALDGQVPTVASAVRWLERLGLIGSAAELDAAAAPNAGTALCVPALAGFAAPRWRPEATGALAGLTLATEPGQLIRAVLEGIAAQVAELVTAAAADLGAPIPALRVDGGLTRSRALMQAVADVAQLRLDVAASAHLTPLGAAALAGCAVEPGRRLEDAVPAPNPSAVFEPAWSADRASEFSAHWRALADSGR